MDKNDRCCRNCRFFGNKHGSRGDCQRYPPQAWADPASETTNPLYFSFPEMNEGDWCGEHQFIPSAKVFVEVEYGKSNDHC